MPESGHTRKAVLWPEESAAGASSGKEEAGYSGKIILHQRSRRRLTRNEPQAHSDVLGMQVVGSARVDGATRASPNEATQRSHPEKASNPYVRGGRGFDGEARRSTRTIDETTRDPLVYF
jgi:hypothetical protein